MVETDILISQGRLDGLSIETIEGINRSIHYTTGRFGSSTTEKLYGVERLPVIHNSTRLALLILREAHAGDDNSSHRMSPSDIIGRGRKFAYIYKPYNLATVVVQTCPRCILERSKSKPSQQKMGLHHEETLSPSPPFTDVSADLTGPFKLKGKERKTWILVYLCNVSKAVHLQVVDSYSAKSVTTALSAVFAIRNLPHRIWTDAGKNLIKSRKLLQESLQSGLTSKDVAEIQSIWPQITWVINPPEAHHRLGGAESMVKAVKRSLKYLPTCHLSLLEFDSALKCIASTINNRPLHFNIQEDQVLTPNHLILGRSYDPVHPPNPLVEAPVAVLLTHVKSIVSRWFQRWSNVVLPNLLRIPKWSSGSVQLKAGDLCLLHHRKSKWSIPTYKYCRILEVLPSHRDGNVRMVRVQYYNFPSKKAKIATVDVRNISLIPQE